MTTPSSPIPPKDPYERYRAEAIEKDKKEGERRFEKPAPKMRSLGAYFLWWLKKLLDLFGKPLPQLPHHKRLLDHLLSFRKGLERMQKEDLSQDSPFLKRLSVSWHFLLQGEEVRPLIQKIRSYPPKQEHTFGYYLSEYAGGRWLPFPFMEMVRKMHLDYLDRGEQSTLAEWISEIDKLIDRLRG